MPTLQMRKGRVKEVEEPARSRDSKVGKSRCCPMSLAPKHVFSPLFLRPAPLHLGFLEVSFPDSG